MYRHFSSMLSNNRLLLSNCFIRHRSSQWNRPIAQCDIVHIQIRPAFVFALCPSPFLCLLLFYHFFQIFFVLQIFKNYWPHFQYLTPIYNINQLSLWQSNPLWLLLLFFYLFEFNLSLLRWKPKTNNLGTYSPVIGQSRTKKVWQWIFNSAFPVLFRLR